MKKTVILMVLLVLVIALGMFGLREEIDRFNPLVSQEYVYVHINQQPEPDDGRFKYKLSGFNVAGEKKKVTFTASTVLKEGVFLKVLAKGTYTKEWEKVAREDVPGAVTQKLQ